MEQQHFLQTSIPTARKVDLFTRYLKKGGEVKVDGRTWVWLDNHITDEVTLADGTIQYYGIDGLAIKSTCYDTVTKETTPYYMGQSDISLAMMTEIVNGVSEVDWVGITGSLALQSMIRKR